MRLKSAYREKIPAAENNPAPSDDQKIQPSETTINSFDTNKAVEPVVVEEKQN